MNGMTRRLPRLSAKQYGRQQRRRRAGKRLLVSEADTTATNNASRSERMDTLSATYSPSTFSKTTMKQWCGWLSSELLGDAARLLSIGRVFAAPSDQNS